MFSFKKTPAPDKKADKKTVFSQLAHGLKKTKTRLFQNTNKKLSAELLADLEEKLLLADVGMNAAQKILDNLNNLLKTRENPEDLPLRQALADVMLDILEPIQAPPLKPKQSAKPLVLLMTGINGAGKTTTIGKLAHHFIAQDYKVMLAAADTFRAAAVEQLQTWGTRNNVPVIAHTNSADPSAVTYDALQSACKKNIDILMIDTAGRLHTQKNLVAQLEKIHRTIGKFNPNLQIENTLVLDSTTGQNAISQAKKFNDAIGINSFVLTKLDGTAKGGVIFALADATKIPVRFIGVGEKIDDLLVFDSKNFVDALLA